MGRPTTHRYATSLRECGLLGYDAASQRYTLGIRFVALARVARAGLHIVEVAGPYLDDLAEWLNETTVLTVWDGGTAVVMRVSEPPHRDGFFTLRVGSRLREGSGHSTVFRAYQPKYAADPKMAKVREDRVFIQDGISQDLRSAVSPIFEREELVGAVGVTSSPGRLSMDASSAAALLVRRVAEQISADLGAVQRGEVPTVLNRVLRRRDRSRGAGDSQPD
jgi:IclR family pca regulon transcriptional regulator